MDDKELFRQQALRGGRWLRELPQFHELHEAGTPAWEALLELALAADTTCEISKRGYLALARHALVRSLDRIDALMAREV